eukprot:CAMPEP_0172086264 /NCGR_PEP_ID=MMETSP1043-20130122/22032_1 /TAXON_ID=464988 /ORGANISM="Hemiselmis andersenii, Strain CCMP441" /LENGTH=99 /DNA_ID=CAMNT_0012748339 /DNA_START=29 /DNA_END=326 /DNA_ORIENTATION=-
MFSRLETKKLDRQACVAELSKLHVHLPVKLPNDNSEVSCTGPFTRGSSEQSLRALEQLTLAGAFESLLPMCSTVQGALTNGQRPFDDGRGDERSAARGG